MPHQHIAGLRIGKQSQDRRVCEVVDTLPDEIMAIHQVFQQFECGVMARGKLESGRSLRFQRRAWDDLEP